jgi:hypothetical protein
VGSAIQSGGQEFNDISAVGGKYDAGKEALDAHRGLDLVGLMKPFSTLLF